MKKLFIIFAVFLTFLFGSAVFAAEKLGPDVPTVFAYIAPGITLSGGAPRLGGQLGVRRSWHPFDLVGEVSLRKENSSLNLLLAKEYGDNRILGGVTLISGAGSPGLVFGVEHKNLLVRFAVYTTESMVAGPCFKFYRYKHCLPDVATSKDHAELFIGYRHQLGSK